jgi:hypothetical protein
MIRLSVFADHRDDDFNRVCEAIGHWRTDHPA